ncbi:MAG: HD domain-containing protein [Acidobacteria bacterium]|nr:MAG: HD domain-containing protein [Acidobacteriota bacterium]
MPFVRQNEPIENWLDGDYAQGFALLSRKEKRQDRNGRDYLDLELKDASGSIVGKVWPDNAAVNGDYSEHDFVAFKGTVRLFRDQLQLSIDHLRRADERDREQGFDPEKLIPTAPGGLDRWWKRLVAIYPGAIEQPLLKRLVEEALGRFGDRLRVHPAARSIHHAYRGGLLEHTVTMAELALKVCDQYPEVDRDVVLVGVLFHDLGKLDELAPMPAADYTVAGHLVGHLVIGRDMLRQCCAALDGLPEELRLHLEHLVLSHHGHRAFGSPVEPNTPEAFVLYFVDDLDSKLNQLRGARRGDGGPIQYVRGLDRHVYVAAPPREDEDSA